MSIRKLWQSGTLLYLMDYKMMYKQLAIHWVDLEPTIGSETQKKRPCVILQSDLINIGSRTIIIAPILPHHKDWPFVINIFPSKANGLDKERHINLKQIRVVDISRVGKKQACIEDQYIHDIQKILKMVFAISE